jgi:hypothetical protein
VNQFVFRKMWYFTTGKSLNAKAHYDVPTIS